MSAALNAPKPKELSESEIKEFFESIEGYCPKDSYSLEQAEIIGNIMYCSTNLHDTVMEMAYRPDAELPSLILSCLVAGFQLGRTFEIKAMARAMREGK